MSKEQAEQELQVLEKQFADRERDLEACLLANVEVAMKIADKYYTLLVLLQARIEGSPKLWVQLFDDTNSGQYVHDARTYPVAGFIEVYAVPVEELGEK